MLLEIGNSYSKLTGMSAFVEKELSKELSYVVGGSSSYFSGFGPKRRSLLSKRGEFPTGLLSRVKKLVQKLSSQPLQVVDSRARPGSRLRYEANFIFTPYLAQYEALNAAVACGQGTLQLPTGSGKSLVAQLITNYFKRRTLIVVPSVGIRDQLRASFKAVFGTTGDILIENIDAKALKTATNYDVLILDECHHSAAKTYQQLNKTAWKGIYYRFCLSATAFRNDTEETLLLESICGRLIYKLPFQRAVKDKMIMPIESYYYELPKVKTSAHTWHEVYSELIVKNDTRNKLISDTLVHLNAQDVSTLCLVKEIEHGNRLSALSGFLFANGQDNSTVDFIRLFNEGEIKTLIGTEGILGEGIDSRPCEYVLICGLGKAKSAFMQKCGRSIRNYRGKESGKVVLFLDNSHKFTKRHFAEQVKILRDEYNISPQKLEL